MVHIRRFWKGHGHVYFGSGGGDLWAVTIYIRLFGRIVGLWMVGTVDGTM